METSGHHELSEEALEDVYNWVDEIPLSRPKKNISRDFADGVLVAEIVKHFIPRLVELHNYNNCENKAKKKENWNILNRKVFKKLGFELADDVLNSVVNAEPFAIEQVLVLLRRKVDRHIYEQKRRKEREHKEKNPAPSNEKAGKTGKKGKSQITMVSKNQDGSISDRPEADQNMKAYPTDSHRKPRFAADRKGNVHAKAPADRFTGEMVPKLAVEEREQEVLAKEETIQILQAKIRRLEHLVHLKDIRIDDLSSMIKEMEDNMRRQKIAAPKRS